MTDHIKLYPTPPRISYVGNGLQTVFTFPFAIFNAGDLAVSLNNALQSGGYVVANAGQSTGGSITFTTAPASGVIIVLERRLALQRVSDFLEGGEFSANSLNNELDYMAGCVQQLAQDMVPMVRVDKTENGFAPTLPARTIRANRVLGFDSDGQFLAIDTTNTYAAPAFYAAGTGASTRTLLDKNREMASVKDYGAVGDGVSDDTNAIINALTAHNAVFLPPGTYQISQTLEIGSNKMLYGAGKTSVIKASGTSFDPISLIGSYSTLADLAIDGGDSGIMLYGKTMPCQNNTVTNILIKNVNIGIELDGYNSTTNTCRWNSFNDITIDGMAMHGIYLQTSGLGDAPMANTFHGIRINSKAVNTTGYGVNVNRAKFNNAIIDCHVTLASTASGGLRLGPNADKVLALNVMIQSPGTFAAVRLENGSTDTMISNLLNATAGSDINDLSNGSYTAINAGSVEKNRLRRTRVSDLTTELQRYAFQTITAVGVSTVTIDLTKSVYLVNTAAGITTMQLPTATTTNSGAIVTIKKTDTSTVNLLVTELAGNGPDGRTIRLGGANDFITVMSDGAKWVITNTNVMPGNTYTHSTAGTFKPDLTRNLYIMNATAGQIIVELPPANAAQSVGRMVTIKKADSSANVVRITEEGATGPDNTAINLTGLYHALSVMSNGTMWMIVSRYS